MFYGCDPIQNDLLLILRYYNPLAGIRSCWDVGTVEESIGFTYFFGCRKPDARRPTGYHPGLCRSHVQAIGIQAVVWEASVDLDYLRCSCPVATCSSPTRRMICHLHEKAL